MMRTVYGTTYNAFILKGSEKVALFETVKAGFSQEFIEKVQSVTDLSKIDYLIMEHTEPDHSGAIEKLLDYNPNIKIVGTNSAINFLKRIVNRDFYAIVAKENDSISLGNKTLRFMPLPNLHWPDTMFTYIEEDKILVTCDAFGAHFSDPAILLSKVERRNEYEESVKYYFDSIMAPFKKPYVTSALARIQNLDIQMIAVGHGPILDTNIQETLALYKKWANEENPFPRKTVVIPFVSAYGYTKKLAIEIAKGIRDSGPIDVALEDMQETDYEAALIQIAKADGVLFGTPTIVGEALYPIMELTILMNAGIHGKKPASAFGSYGWSGEGVPHILERLNQLKMKVVDGFKVRFKPSEKDLIDAYEYGYNFGCIVQNIENVKKDKPKEKRFVRCLICGAVFEEGTETCPVCGVGKENFVPTVIEEAQVHKNTSEIFLILGSGIAAVSAAKAIRERNKTASVFLVSNEKTLPYNRPMLTKDMLAGMDENQIAIVDPAWYSENKIELMLGVQIQEINPVNKEVLLTNGKGLYYDKLIYALGSECFIPPFKGVEKDGVLSIRRTTDIQKLIAQLKTAQKAVVIGGGILGLEAAWELKKAKLEVTVLELADRLMPRQIDANASEMMKNIIKAAEMEVQTGVTISMIRGEKHVTGVELADGRRFDADLVLISCGVRPNVEIAGKAGIEIGKSVKVNEKMETNLAQIYAAGDCAEYNGMNYSIWPQALEMGKVAGMNAAGEDAVYHAIAPAVTLSALHTKLYAVGDNGSNPAQAYKTVEYKDPSKHTYEKYYFVNNRLVGMILIGDVSKMIKMTEAIEDGATFSLLFPQ
jgi:flavorubredoxin/NADPH-dependent 2,4-dienoyl-CoA reductase/sulfur reductase-like enzyme